MYYIAIVLCLVAAVKADFVLSEAGKKCADESKISKEDLHAFCTGNVPEDVPAVEHYFDCRYGKNFDDHNELICNTSTFREILVYYESVIEDKTRAAILAVTNMFLCKSAAATGDTRLQVIMAVSKCIIEKMKEQ